MTRQFSTGGGSFDPVSFISLSPSSAMPAPTKG
jgi:hypothetical protein